ncbi:aldo/keto reductase [Vibrio mimicus]
MLKIGQELELNRIGLGCMGMSEFYGISNDNDSLKVMSKAVELGINCFDTADLYGNGHNEKLIGRFLKHSQVKPAIATKCGIVRHKEIRPDGNFKRSYNGSAEYIINSCEASLKRLGIECIDIFYLHRTDPGTPIEESTEALAKLKSQGKIKAIGLSEVSYEELSRAHQVHPIDCLQSEYSLWSREVEDTILPFCEKNNIIFVAFSPLGRGLANPTINIDSNDFRVNIPRFSQQNMSANKPLFTLIESIGKNNGITNAQVCLAWLLQASKNLMAIPGTRHIHYLEQNILAESLTLTMKELKQLDCAFSPDNVHGAKYLVT